MWVSVSSFERGLWAEHHDELGFLYRQIAHHRDDGTLPRERLADFEWRLVAHLDGLVLGAARAWREMGARHDDDDAGHWYAAGLLACAQRDEARWAALLQRAARPDTPQAGPALADALRHAMPAKWGHKLAGWLAAAPQPLLGWLADAASHMALPCKEVLERRLLDGVDPTVELMRACGRAGAIAAAARLQEVVRARDATPASRCAALLALFELRVPDALVSARLAAAESAVFHPVLGMVGGRQDAGLMLQRLEAAPAPGTAIGLGLLGSLSAVRPLVAALPNEGVGASAAIALEWITGAGLTDEVSDDDEESRDPAEGSYRRLQARPSVGRVTRAGRQQPSRDAARWTQWLTEAAPRFKADLRYRLGRPYAAAWLVQTLVDARQGGSYQRLARDELVVRYAPPHHLDPRASVARERLVLEQLGHWARTPGPQAVHDGWMLAGTTT